jgi:hypothetical protein
MKMPNTLDRNQQLERLRERYARRHKDGKSRMLDELCEQHGYSRKHAIKLLGHWLPKPKGSSPPGPEPRYGPVREVLEDIWRAAEQLCGKRLAPALPLWLPHYAKHFNPLLPCQQKLLQEISPATIDRLWVDCKAAPHGLCATRPGTLLREQIPIAGEVWDEKRPGFLEVDSVAHCGGSLAGDFIWSLTYTCLGSSWTEGRAVWNKGFQGVLIQTQDVEARLPFALRGMDFDNGGEWLNWQLVRFLQERKTPVQVTRSRPYHKDDNAHVEQKNWMWPRQLLGYQRLENPDTLTPINELYRDVWGPLHNFFLPSMKLVEKRREGSRIIRRHDEPQTAYQRLLGAGQLQRSARQQLREQYESLDPFALAKAVEQRLKKILN